MNRAVWIVIDESDGAPQVILGVFSQQSEALSFMDEIGPEYAAGTLSMGSYVPGWSIRNTCQRYRTSD